MCCVRWALLLLLLKEKKRAAPARQQRVRDCFATVWRHGSETSSSSRLHFLCFPYFFFFFFPFLLFFLFIFLFFFFKFLFASILSFLFLTILMCCIMLHYYEDGHRRPSCFLLLSFVIITIATFACRCELMNSIRLFHLWWVGCIGGGLEMNKAGRGRDADEEGDDKVDGEEQAPGPLLVSFTTACGVTFVLCLIWMASRWKITCLRSSADHHSRQTEDETLSFSGPVCHPLAPSASTASAAPPAPSSGGRRQQQQQQRQHSLWTWISPNPSDRGGHHVHQQLDVDDDESLPNYDRQLLDLGQATDQDRVALIAYMNDSNTSSQVIDETLPSFSCPFKRLTRVIHTQNTRPHTHDVTCNMRGVGPEKRTYTHTHTAPTYKGLEFCFFSSSG